MFRYIKVMPELTSPKIAATCIQHNIDETDSTPQMECRPPNPPAPCDINMYAVGRGFKYKFVSIIKCVISLHPSSLVFNKPQSYTIIYK